jgi:prevent-host-death family protein
VLKDVDEGSPVFLTKNGRGRYAIVDIRDYEKDQATKTLKTELAKGKQTGEAQGWLTAQDVRAHFEGKAHDE